MDAEIGVIRCLNFAYSSKKEDYSPGKGFTTKLFIKAVESVSNNSSKQKQYKLKNSKRFNDKFISSIDDVFFFINSLPQKINHNHSKLGNIDFQTCHFIIDISDPPETPLPNYDGNSAGLAVFLAVLSAFFEFPILSEVAVTGTLRSKVSDEIGLVGEIEGKISGLIEKKNHGITKIIIPDLELLIKDEFFNEKKIHDVLNRLSDLGLKERQLSVIFCTRAFQAIKFATSDKSFKLFLKKMDKSDVFASRFFRLDDKGSIIHEEIIGHKGGYEDFVNGKIRVFKHVENVHKIKKLWKSSWRSLLIIISTILVVIYFHFILFNEPPYPKGTLGSHYEEIKDDIGAGVPLTLNQKKEYLRNNIQLNIQKAARTGERTGYYKYDCSFVSDTENQERYPICLVCVNITNEDGSFVHYVLVKNYKIIRFENNNHESGEIDGIQLAGEQGKNPAQKGYIIALFEEDIRTFYEILEDDMSNGSYIYYPEKLAYSKQIAIIKSDVLDINDL